MIIHAGNAGLVTTTGGGVNDLCHTLPIDPNTAVTRSAIIVKILAYNPGAQTTLIFGTLDRNPAGAGWVPMLPTLTALATLDNEWTEVELPAIEFQNNITPNALVGRTGDIYVQDAGVGGVLVQIEVKEIASAR
jgi:hypothetical protein